MHIQRSQIIRGATLLIALLFIVRLFFIQILSQEYASAAEKNIVRPVIEHPVRGMIYDRHGNLLTHNAPVYDLMVTPNAIRHLDKEAFCHDFSLTLHELEQRLKKAKSYSYVKPSVLIKNISPSTWARVQDNMEAYAGFFVTVRTTRHYPYAMLANTLGYMSEIGPQQLAADQSCYYRQGDWIGMSGLEQYYETILRGQRGMRYDLTNARGVYQGKFKSGKLDHPSVPGQPLTTTIDTTLQAYGEELMQRKLGSIVAIEPATGEILAMVSSPTYDPNQLVGKLLGKSFASLGKEADAPLFHRPIMAMYPPGSIFKLVQVLIALQEDVIQPSTQYGCKKRPFNCREHPTPLNLQQALQHSCNSYLYQVFKRIVNQQVTDDVYEDTRIGLEKWHHYVQALGLGVPLGIDLPGEKKGFIPNAAFYDQCYGVGRWKVPTIRSLAIGQGELMTTPLQMANLMAVIANKGYYYTPHLVKQIGTEAVGEDVVRKHSVDIAPQHFTFIAQSMREVVEQGSAWRARIKGISICAKTGTVENPHGHDHSVCVAFAPQDNPQIAIAVYVENAGWGARAAASIAGLMVEQYLRGKVTRSWIQQYVKQGNFFH